MTKIRNTTPEPQPQQDQRITIALERSTSQEVSADYIDAASPKLPNSGVSLLLPLSSPPQSPARLPPSPARLPDATIRPASPQELPQQVPRRPRTGSRMPIRELTPGIWRFSQQPIQPAAPAPMPAAAMPTAAMPTAAMPAGQAQLPSVATLTPGGDAWWKRAAQTPGPLHDVYAASMPLFRHRFGTLPEGELVQAQQVREAAFAGNVEATRELLLLAYAQLQKQYTTELQASIGTVRDTEADRMELTGQLRLELDGYRLQAMVYALVGTGPSQDKQALLRMLSGGREGRLVDVRMQGMNLLHLACIAPMAAEHRVAMIRYLKACELEPHSAAESGLTPLHCAAAQPDGMFMISTLLEGTSPSDFNLNARDDAGRTPLFYAYAAQPSNTQVINWLRDRGASAHVVSKRGESLMHALLRHGDHPVELTRLLADGLSYAFRDADGMSSGELARRLGRGQSFLLLLQRYMQDTANTRAQRPYLGSTQQTEVPQGLSFMIPTP